VLYILGRIRGKIMETKVLEIENLKEQIFELQEDNHSCSLKNIDLKRQIAMLQDGFEYQKDMADVYAKALRGIWDKLDDLYANFSEDEDFELKGDVETETNYILRELRLLKNSIPETALKRGNEI
jgi:regulator of replication initiation timing